MVEDAEKNQAVMREGKSAWYKIPGYVTIYQNDDTRPMYYLACPACKKKVLDEVGGYRCENCSKSYGEAVPTYNFSF